MSKAEGFKGLEHAIAEVLRAARLKRKLSKSQLAERMHCPKSYISKVESGYCTPGLPSLARFALALGTPAWNLLRNAELRLEQPAKPPATSAVETQPQQLNPAA